MIKPQVIRAGSAACKHRWRYYAEIKLTQGRWCPRCGRVEDVEVCDFNRPCAECRKKGCTCSCHRPPIRIGPDTKFGVKMHGVIYKEL